MPPSAATLVLPLPLHLMFRAPTRVTFDRLHSISESPYGINNRDIRKDRRDEMVEDFSPVACGVWTAFQSDKGADAPLWVMSGHHRRGAVEILLSNEGIPAEDLPVFVQVYTPADADAEGLTPADFIRRHMGICNTQREQELSDDLEQTQKDSVWVKEFAKHNMTVGCSHLKRNQLNYPTLIKTYFSVRKAFEDVATLSPQNVLARFKVKATNDDVKKVFKEGIPWQDSSGKVMKDPFIVQVVRAIAEWEQGAAIPLSASSPPVNLRSKECLAFVMFVYMGNQKSPILRGTPDRFTNPVATFSWPTKKKGKGLEKLTMRETLAKLLEHANSGRRAHNRVGILGLHDIG